MIIEILYSAIAIVMFMYDDKSDLFMRVFHSVFWPITASLILLGKILLKGGRH